MPGIRRSLAPVLLAAAALSAVYAVERALACPITPPPQTLHALYKQSARVVVARVGASEVLKREDMMALVRTVLHVRGGTAAQAAPRRAPFSVPPTAGSPPFGARPGRDV